jgi:spore coat polysaccharide biosynthesis predicted glycosyltransferase SpsG
LLLDDTGRKRLAPVDILLNQNIHADPGLYLGADERTELMLGLKHTMLRREFLGKRPEPRVPSRARRLLVTLGGGDPNNFSGKVLQSLETISSAEIEARVLVGGANPHGQVLADQAAALSQRVEILSGVEDMLTQYIWADMVVTAGGGTLWELAYLGVPSVTMIVAPNQEPASNRLHQMGAVNCLGWAGELSVESLGQSLSDLMDDPDRRSFMVETGRRLIDGRGAERVVQAMALKQVRNEEVKS